MNVDFNLVSNFLMANQQSINVGLVVFFTMMLIYLINQGNKKAKQIRVLTRQNENNEDRLSKNSKAIDSYKHVDRMMEKYSNCMFDGGYLNDMDAWLTMFSDKRISKIEESLASSQSQHDEKIKNLNKLANETLDNKIKKLEDENAVLFADLEKEKTNLENDKKFVDKTIADLKLDINESIKEEKQIRDDLKKEIETLRERIKRVRCSSNEYRNIAKRLTEFFDDYEKKDSHGRILAVSYEKIKTGVYTYSHSLEKRADLLDNNKWIAEG